jgi:hypothetical protein
LKTAERPSKVRSQKPEAPPEGKGRRGERGEGREERGGGGWETTDYGTTDLCGIFDF